MGGVVGCIIPKFLCADTEDKMLKCINMMPSETRKKSRTFYAICIKRGTFSESDYVG